MKAKSGKIYRVQTVSFPDESLLDAAKSKAKSQRRSLSNYICGLLEDDLRAAGVYPDLSRSTAAALNEPSSKIKDLADREEAEAMEVARRGHKPPVPR